MRITPNDVKLITAKYKRLNEDVGLGAGVPKQLNVTSIGSQGPKIPRSPIAALKGEVPGVAGVEESEESALPMAKGNINNLLHRAQMLQELIQHESEIEPWIAAKITLATDYVETIVNYLKFRDEGGFEHEVEGDNLDNAIGVNIIDLETRE